LDEVVKPQEQVNMICSKCLCKSQITCMAIYISWKLSVNASNLTLKDSNYEQQKILHIKNKQEVVFLVLLTTVYELQRLCSVICWKQERLQMERD